MFAFEIYSTFLKEEKGSATASFKVPLGKLKSKQTNSGNNRKKLDFFLFWRTYKNKKQQLKMLGKLKPILRSTRLCSVTATRVLSSQQPESDSKPVPSLELKPKKMSSAMKFYMEKKRKQDEFMAHERSEFELGKKHLGNMMGMDADSMTQEDIDKAIDYLFPSGLYEPKARPKMKPPEEVFPRQKDAEFDFDGRPYHPFFYCKKPRFIQILYEIAEHISNVTFFAERMAKQNRHPDPDQVLDETALASTRWITAEELAEDLIEKMEEKEYDDMITAFERLLENPFAYKSRDFIFK